MVQIRQETARLRLLLAEIIGREEQLDGLVRQFRTQLNRLPRQAIYSRTTLDAAMAAMSEIQERLDHTLMTRQHLEAIKQRASSEFTALELTQQVEQAKDALAELKSKYGSEPTPEEDASAEMRRLEEFIAEYSKKAERAITSES